ncbi:hypothetical protein [Phenylobacterium sp.]|uniref:hypothetical protein n=1 Tax=Phenylobacterium sp. TaxID=1871053 RepID=UPI002FE077FE
MALRQAAWRERQRLAEDRWRRFQASTRKRYGGSAARALPPAAARLLARGKFPGRALLLALSGAWLDDVEAGLGSRPGEVSNLLDYVRAGPDPAAQPRALFDQAWYLEQAPALAGSRWAPLAHYLILGDLEGRSPHPLIDVRRLRGPGDRLTALQRFLFHAAAEGIDPHPLFDLRFYVGQSDELAETGENPLVHYLRQGWREGRDPHPLFANAWYLNRTPGAPEAGIAPLLHYVTTGAAAGADPHPLFETAWWGLEPRRASAAHDPLSDFLRTGGPMRRSPTPRFDPDHYLAQAGGDPAAAASPLLHYVTAGTFLGLSPAPDFDEAAWFAAHPKAAAEARSALELAARAEPATARPAPAPRDDWVSYLAEMGSTAPGRRPGLEPQAFVVRRGPPADLATADRLLARHRLAGFCHEVASREEARALWAAGAADLPFLLALAGPVEAGALAPALSSDKALRIEGRPALLVPPGVRAEGLAGFHVVSRGALPCVRAGKGGPGVLQARLERAMADAPVLLVDDWDAVAPGERGHAWLEACANAYDAGLLER